MELKSEYRRRLSSQHLGLGIPGGGADHISDLPDDLLLLVLTRLRCAATAARASVLSSRWRGLWACLHQIIFHDVVFHKLEAVLGGLSPSVSVLEIHVSNSTCSHEDSDVRSLLRAVTRLAPEKFVLALPGPFRPNSAICVELPCFHRTTTIVFDSPYLCIRVPSDVNFPALETFSLLDCMIDKVDDVLPRCPRLPVLRLKRMKFGYRGRDMRVHSASLEELDVENVWIRSVDIVAPSLKQLAMSMNTYVELNVSISALLVEKISWQCSFVWVPGKIAFAPWCLDRLLLKTAEKQGKPTSLQIHASTCNNSQISPDQAEKGTREIEKHVVYAFSVLELHLETTGHVFGAFVFHIIGINKIRNAMQSLKVVLWRSKEMLE